MSISTFLTFQSRPALVRFETSLDLPKEENVIKTDEVHDGVITPDSELEKENLETQEIERTRTVSLDEPKLKRFQGPRALRRRHGKKYHKSTLQRKSSFNGHW